MGQFVGIFSAEIIQGVRHRFILFVGIFVFRILKKNTFSTERSDFKREPCKVCSLDGWSAQLIDQTGQQMNTFQLINTQLGTVYKFRTGSPNMTVQWLDALRRRSGTDTSTMDTHLPAVNLMTFE